MSYEFGPAGAVVAEIRNLPDQLKRPVLLGVRSLRVIPTGQNRPLAATTI